MDGALISTSPKTSHLDIATDVALISPWAAPYLHLHIAVNPSSRHRHRRHFRHGQRLISTSLSSTAEYRPRFQSCRLCLQSAIQRICFLVFAVPRDHSKAGVLFATRLPPTPAPTHRSFVSTPQTPVPVPTHARCHPYVRIGKGPNGYGCERVTGAIIVFELWPPWHTRSGPVCCPGNGTYIDGNGL